MTFGAGNWAEMENNTGRAGRKKKKKKKEKVSTGSNVTLHVCVTSLTAKTKLPEWQVPARKERRGGGTEKRGGGEGAISSGNLAGR